MNRKERWTKALNLARRNGAKIRQNVMGCCRSCIAYEGKVNGYIWSYGGQGGKTYWVGGIDDDYMTSGYYGNYVKASPNDFEVYFYFENLHDALTLRDALRVYDFEVDWDGTTAHAVGVYVNR